MRILLALAVAASLAIAGWLLVARQASARPAPQLVVQRGHDGAILSVDFSPDGKLFATGGADATVRLWDARTGILRRVLSGHSSAVGLVRFLRDGRLVTGEGHWHSYNGSGVVRFWNPRTGALLLTRRGPDAMRFKSDRPEDITRRYITAVAVSPDGRFIARAGAIWESDRRFNSQVLVTLQETASGKMLTPLRAPTQRIATLVFAPDGRTVAATGWSSPILLWDVKTGKLRRRLPEKHTYSHLAFSPDGSRLASAVMQDGKAGNTLHIWDLGSGRIVRRFHGTGSQNGALQFSRDGAHLISGGYRQIRFWNTRTGTVDAIFEVEGAVGSGMALAPGGKCLAGTSGGTIRVWDVASRRLLWSRNGTTSSQRGLRAMRQENGKTLQTRGEDGSTTLWTLPDLQPQKEYRTAKKERIVALSPNGVLLVVDVPGPDRTSKWQIRNAKTGAVKLAVPAAGGGFEASTGGFFSHDSTRLIETSMSDVGGYGGMQMWDAASGRAIMGFSDRPRIVSLAFSPDDSLLALGDYDGAVTLWNARTGAKLGGATLGDKPVVSVAFSATRQVAATDGKGAARLWELRDSAFVPGNLAIPPPAAIRLFAFSPDGRLLAGSDKSALMVWNACDGQLLQRIFTAPATLVSLDFSGDGRRVFAAGEDGSVRFWRVDDGQLRLTLWPKLTPPAREWLAVTPDGFYTGSNRAEKFMVWREEGEIVSGETLRATRRNARKVAVALSE